MSTIPKGVKFLAEGFGETPEPTVQRDEMERGPINQELINSRMRYVLPVTILMERKQYIADFMSWWKNDLGVIGYFDLKHPRTGEMIRARFVGGKIGTLQMIAPGWRAASLSTELEYWA